MLNFDLLWNPTSLEPRIGWLGDIGQQRNMDLFSSWRFLGLTLERLREEKDLKEAIVGLLGITRTGEELHRQQNSLEEKAGNCKVCSGSPKVACPVCRSTALS